MVLMAVMGAYSEALAAYLKTEKQQEVAERVNVTQASISRYATGERFPSREIAEQIDQATSGQVPVGLWIAEAAVRFGLARDAAA